MSELIVTTSWDDGQKTDLKTAELLTKYNIKGTFYITKCYRNPLDKQEVIEIDREHEIGAHTLSHVDLTNTSTSEVDMEIKGSKAYSEDIVGHSILMFCYPYGKYNKSIKRIVRDCGFAGARTCESGGFTLPQDPYQWSITLLAENGSPLIAFKTWREFRLRGIIPLLDWESRSKALFDIALGNGGVYHIVGHSAAFEKRKEWDKLERVLKYFSNREGVKYLTNGEVFKAYPIDGEKCIF